MNLVTCDYLILTASNEHQANIYRRQLEIRRQLGFLTGIGGSIITVWGIYGSGLFHRILSSTATRYVATLGYGVYLFHLLVIKKITNGLIENVPFTGNLDFLGHWLAGLTATLLLSYLFAYVLHLLVEKPSLYLRRRLT